VFWGPKILKVIVVARNRGSITLRKEKKVQVLSNTKIPFNTANKKKLQDGRQVAQIELASPKENG
jgi:hypothetical protein